MHAVGVRIGKDFVELEFTFGKLDNHAVLTNDSNPLSYLCLTELVFFLSENV